MKNIQPYKSIQILTEKMSKFEYDYNAVDIDEHVTINALPATRQPLHTSHFRSEELSSHRRVLMDLQEFIKESKNKEQEKIQLLKNRQKNIGEELDRQREQKEEKIKRLQQQQKVKMNKECTFRPKLAKNPGPKRNFNEFLDNQYAHSQKVMEKRKMLKKNLEERKDKATYRPKINNSIKKGRRESQDKNTVFDRLYNLKDKEKEEINQFEEGRMFHPTINQRSKNLARDGPVQELLYNDAQRRQEKSRQPLSYSNINCQRSEKPLNYTNQKYAAQKFIKEYFFMLEDLKLESSNNSTIDYMMFGELLKGLGFTTNEEEQQTKASSAERALIHDAYEILSKYQVNARNVCVFLLGLLGIYHINPVNFEEGDEPLQEKEFNLDESDGRRLQRHFDLFYRNRLSSEAIRRNEEKTENFSFQPRINKQSVELADKHRNSMLQQANQLLQQYPELEFVIPEDGVISHTDLLVLHRMAKDIQNEAKKEERDQKQLEQCTFKPNTNSSMNSLNASKYSEGGHLGYKKSFQLYNFHKNLQSKKESLQSSRNNQEDKQCTFAPQINKNKPIKQPSVPMSKQTDETLYRMYKGRQQYEEKRNFLERGEKKSRNRRESEKTEPDRVPNLILDVNLGDKVDRIILYQGDENRLAQVAHQFAEKHALEPESEENLLELLNAQLENLLSKIEEDEESDPQY